MIKTRRFENERVVIGLDSPISLFEKSRNIGAAERALDEISSEKRFSVAKVVRKALSLAGITILAGRDECGVFRDKREKYCGGERFSDKDWHDSGDATEFHSEKLGATVLF